MSVERLQRCRVKLRSWLVKEEEEISQAITDAQSKSSSRLERSQCKFLAEDELERAILMLKETLDEPPDALKKDVATALEVLEMERNALLKEMRASSPPYMLHLVEAKDIIHQVQDPAGEEPCRVPPTMAPNLENRWKSLVLELLHESKRGMERRWQGTELAGPAGLIKHVQANIYTLDIPHVLKGVREAYDRACKIEAEHDRCLDTSLKALHKINQEIEIQRASLDSLGRGATLAERVKKVEEARQAARNTGKGVGIDEGMKNAGGSLPPQGLQQVKRLDRTPGRSLADYQQMITQCGDRGEPLTAMAAYESMIRHQWKPTHHTFWHLLRAFKNARPPRPMQALQVLDEMKIQGVVVMTKHYNQVVDCCKSSGQWRVALRVVSSMEASGTASPNAATYTALASVCRNTEEQPWQIYEALRAAGVPRHHCMMAGLANVDSEKRTYPAYLGKVVETTRKAKPIVVPQAAPKAECQCPQIC